MTARISVAEARRLGIDVPAKTSRNRTVARGPYRSVCHTCGTVFTTYAGEDRHVHDTHHARYSTLEGTP